MQSFRVGEKRQFLFSHNVSDIVALIPMDQDPIWDADKTRQSNPLWKLTETRSLIFIWSDTFSDTEERHRNSKLWGAIHPLVRRLEAHFAGAAKRVFIANLPVGGGIPPHADGGDLLVPTVNRCHIALETNPLVEFLIGGEPFTFPVGDVFEISNVDVHAVSNRGSIRRLHLIVDVLPDDYTLRVMNIAPACLEAILRNHEFLVDRNTGLLLV
jgi:Aspartyl/Asparaginyl beta-hydroxylase